MSLPKRGLGKGLEALIPKKIVTEPQSTGGSLIEVAIGRIKTNPYQPRQIMDTAELQELSASIKENGFIQPLVVRKGKEDTYELIAGGRRFEAAQMLGLEKVPVMIKNVGDKESFVLAIVENLQRKDLNPIEEAQAFKKLMDDFGMNLEEVGKFVAKDKSTVANALRLLKLPIEIRQALQKGLISRSQARTILGLPTEVEQARLFQEMLSAPMSVREIEARAKAAKAVAGKKKNDLFVVDLEQKLQTKLGTKVRIHNGKNNRGKIVIEYYNLDDMERITRRIG